MKQFANIQLLLIALIFTTATKIQAQREQIQPPPPWEKSEGYSGIANNILQIDSDNYGTVTNGKTSTWLTFGRLANSDEGSWTGRKWDRSERKIGYIATSDTYYDWAPGVNKREGNKRFNAMNLGYIYITDPDDKNTREERPIMSLLTNGNVGVGTTSPENKLTVISEDKFGITHKRGSISLSTWINNESAQIGANTNHYLGFYTNNNTASMVLNTNGNLGIGTSSPTEKLDVKGNIVAQEFRSELTAATKLHKGEIHVNYPIIKDASGSPIVVTDKPYYYVSTTTATPIAFATDNKNRLMIDALGNVYIGTSSYTLSGTTPTFYPRYDNMANNGGLLNVNGRITARELKITSTGWADYVFEQTYKLRSLNEVESYIAKNKHLPDVPSAAAIETNGLDVEPIMKAQMQKIEELTLYLIEQNKLIQNLKTEVENLKKTK